MLGAIGRLLRVQRPPDWMFDALGILQGTNPQDMSTTLLPVVDTMQGGHAKATYLDAEFVGAVGAAVGPTTIFVAQTFPINDRKFSYLLRCEARNPGGGAVTFTLRCFKNPNFQTRVINVTLAAGAVAAWNDMNGGQQWLHIPPGYDLTMETSAFAVTAGGLRFTLVQLPTAAKGW